MRVTFFRVAERKSPKKGRPGCLRPLRCAAGQPGVLARGVHRRTRCAPAALRSNNCGESVHEARVSFGTQATPRPARPRRIQKGTRRTSIRAIAALGPISRAQAPRAAQPGPSEAMARVAVRLSTPLLAAPAAGRLRGEHARRSAHASCSDSPWLSERRCAAAKRVPRRTPQPPRRRLPRSAAQGSQTGGRLSFAYFSLAKQRKVSRLPGRQPGLRPQHKHARQTSTPQLRQAGGMAPRLRQAQPERTGGQKLQKQ